jgi:hypothetical protein
LTLKLADYVKGFLVSAFLIISRNGVLLRD